MDYILGLMPQVLEGLKVTLEIFAMTLVLSIPLGILVGLMRTSKSIILSKLSGAYVLIMRGTPLLLQIIVIFFGLPLVGITFERFPSGIQAIDEGQIEAAEVLGITPKDTFFRIILPQAFKTVLPPVANEITTLVKDTSLVYIVGMDELLKVGKIASNRDVSLVPLLVVGAIYLIVIGILSKVLRKVEEKYDYYK